MIKNDKKTARVLLKKVLEDISEEERALCAEKACALIVENSFFKKSSIVLSYSPMKTEFDVSKITAAALGAGKKVYFPVISDSGNEMDFYRVDSAVSSENSAATSCGSSAFLCGLSATSCGQFKKNIYGIYEPEKNEYFDFECFLNKKENDAESEMSQKLALKNITVLVPGLGFSLKGERLGRGKGYYDFYLSRLLDLCRKNQCEVFLVGCCFFSQTEVPFFTEAHDIKMDALLTEKSLTVLNPKNMQ